jgi:oxalate decarboxylase/phosphoglucose isomerase-like protein (cupin superfamily)
VAKALGFLFFDSVFGIGSTPEDLEETGRLVRRKDQQQQQRWRGIKLDQRDLGATIAVGIVDIEAGGMKEMHWHPNTDEWQYYIQGDARITVFAAEHLSWTFNYTAGDVGVVPFAMSHYIQNTCALFRGIQKAPSSKMYH